MPQNLNSNLDTVVNQINAIKMYRLVWFS